MKKDWEVCSECRRKMQRCRVVAQMVDEEKELVYVCRQCFRDLDYEKYLYEHRHGTQEKQL